jgi:hypothetical protein
VTVDVLFEPWQPVFAGVAAAIQADVHVGGVPIRVDADRIRSEVLPDEPMVLLERNGLRLLAESMSGGQDVAVAGVRVTVIGTSIDQVDTIRGRIERILVGRGPGGFWSALAIAGMHVVDRRPTMDVLPAPTVGGSWANAYLPVSLLLQPTS